MIDESRRTDLSTGGDSITVGDISNATGVAIGHRASAVVTQHVSGDVDGIAKAFEALHQALAQKPDTPKKAMAEQAVKGLEAEAIRGEQADESNVEEWFTSLMAMLPDVAEVAVNTFINPISGLSTVFQKIAQKAKEARAAA